MTLSNEAIQRMRIALAGGSAAQEVADALANTVTTTLLATDQLHKGYLGYALVSATDNLLASAGGSAHVDFASTYSLPAGTLVAGSVVRIKAMVYATDITGTDTLEVKLYFGGTTLLTSTAVDPTVIGDFVLMEFEITSRAAASAASSCAGVGTWRSNVGSGTQVHGSAILTPTNFATNGAIIIKASAKWSSTTANTNARLAHLTVEILP